jgi:ribonuclease HI
VGVCESMKTGELRVFVDGTGEAGYGAWALVVHSDTKPVLVDFRFGTEVTHSHQPMELTAAIKAAQWLGTNAPLRTAEILSDSKNYIVRCFDEKWYIRWQQSEPWRGSGRRKVKYVDLWKSLFGALNELEYVQRINYVTGHKGIQGNVQAHALCRAALRSTHPNAAYRWTWDRVVHEIRLAFDAARVKESDGVLRRLRQFADESAEIDQRS